MTVLQYVSYIFYNNLNDVIYTYFELDQLPKIILKDTQDKNRQEQF